MDDDQSMAVDHEELLRSIVIPSADEGDLPTESMPVIIDLRSAAEHVSTEATANHDVGVRPDRPPLVTVEDTRATIDGLRDSVRDLRRENAQLTSMLNGAKPNASPVKPTRNRDDELANELRSLIAAGNEVASELETATAERNQAQHERDQAITARNKLADQLETATAERNQAQHERDQAVSARTEIADQRDRAIHAGGELAEQLEKVTSQLAASKHENDARAQQAFEAGSRLGERAAERLARLLPADQL